MNIPEDIRRDLQIRPRSVAAFYAWLDQVEAEAEARGRREALDVVRLAPQVVDQLVADATGKMLSAVLAALPVMLASLEQDVRIEDVVRDVGGRITSATARKAWRPAGSSRSPAPAQLRAAEGRGLKAMVG